jgi:hypothetical protein
MDGLTRGCAPTNYGWERVPARFYPLLFIKFSESQNDHESGLQVMSDE